MAGPIQEATTQICPDWVQFVEDSLQTAFTGIEPLIERAPRVVSRVSLGETPPAHSEWRSAEPDLFVSIKCPLDGDIEGALIWLTSWETARQVWKASLGGAPVSLSELTDVEIATMLEVGSQFSEAFADALSGKSGIGVRAGAARIAVETQSAIFETVFPEAISKSPFVGYGFQFDGGDTDRFEALVFFHGFCAAPFTANDQKEAA